MTLVASHAVLSNEENCPRKAYRKFVVRNLPRETSPELEWGNDVHEAMRLRLAIGAPLPEPMQAFEPFALSVVETGLSYIVEHRLGMTRDGRACDFRDPEVWLRGVVDLALGVSMEEGVSAIKAVILDWKTGKVREDPYELRLHALCLKALNPALERVVGHYVWLKDMQVGVQHDLSDFAATWRDVETRTARINRRLAENDWPPTSNPLCGWCPVADCEFNRRKR